MGFIANKIAVIEDSSFVRAMSVEIGDPLQITVANERVPVQLQNIQRLPLEKGVVNGVKVVVA